MKPKVLLVDDDSSVLESTCLLLDQLGFQGIPLSTPHNVVRVASKEQPVAILHDMQMPRLDPATIVRQLRRSPETSRIPLYLFSARADVADYAARVDAAGFLIKPFRRYELEKALQGAIASTQADDEQGDHWAAQTDETLFHEAWNTMTSLNTYIDVLRSNRHMSPAERRRIAHVDRLLLRICHLTDQMQTAFKVHTESGR